MKKHLPLLMLVGMFTAHLQAQDLYLGPGASMHISAGTTVAVKGNLSVQNASGITGTGTLMLNGATTQTISGSALVLPALSLDNSAGVRITENKSLSGELTLNSTVLTVDSGQAIHVNQNAVNRSSGFVNGRLTKTFTPSALQKTFEVGSASNYLPVQLTYVSATSNFEVAVEAKSNAVASIPSALSQTKFVNAHHTVLNINAAPNTYNAQFTFLPSQLQGGAASASLVAAVDTANNAFTSSIAQTASTASSASFSINKYGRIQLGESGAIVVNLKALLEGFHIANGQMQPVLANSGIGSSAVLTDTLTLELRGSTSPYTVIATQKAVLDTAGNGLFTFNNVAAGNYYLVAKHRNHLATWSASAVACSPNTSYNFSSSASQAFDNNMKDLGNGFFALYAGDVNQDGFLDGNDFTDVDNDNFNGEFGYKITDLDGDGFVGGTDYSNMDNNNFNGVFFKAPIGSTYSIRRNSGNTQIIINQKSK